MVAGLDLVERGPAVDLPPAHVGIHTGPVISQDGDVYGRTVNLASRIASYAHAGQVVVSRDGAALWRPPAVVRAARSRRAQGRRQALAALPGLPQVLGRRDHRCHRTRRNPLDAGASRNVLVHFRGIAVSPMVGCGLPTRLIGSGRGKSWAMPRPSRMRSKP